MDSDSGYDYDSLSEDDDEGDPDYKPPPKAMYHGWYVFICKFCSTQFLFVMNSNLCTQGKSTYRYPRKL
jgi:hypothetical protein